MDRRSEPRSAPVTVRERERTGEQRPLTSVRKRLWAPRPPPHLATVRGLDVHVPPSQTVDLGFQSTGELDLQMKREELQCSLVVEYLPSMQEVLGSIPSTG